MSLVMLLLQDRIPKAPYSEHQRAVEGVPCSLNQEQMISIALSSSNTEYYTQPLIFELKGELNESAMKEALQMLTARHDALRTCFIMDQASEPLQLVLPIGGVHMPLHIVQHPDAKQVSFTPVVALKYTGRVVAARPGMQRN